jgi:hypothetical protein
MCDGGKIN